jgi:hypothetical protein
VRMPNPVDANRPAAVNVPGMRCLPCMQLYLALVLQLEGNAMVVVGSGGWVWRGCGIGSRVGGPE